MSYKFLLVDDDRFSRQEFGAERSRNLRSVAARTKSSARVSPSDGLTKPVLVILTSAFAFVTKRTNSNNKCNGTVSERNSPVKKNELVCKFGFIFQGSFTY